MKRLHILGIAISLLVMTGCSSTPKQVKTTNTAYSEMTTNDPCVTKRANCSPAEADASAAKYSNLNQRILTLEERQHQAELRAIDNRINDSNRVSDLGAK